MLLEFFWGGIYTVLCETQHGTSASQMSRTPQPRPLQLCLLTSLPPSPSGTLRLLQSACPISTVLRPGVLQTLQCCAMHDTSVSRLSIHQLVPIAEHKGASPLSCIIHCCSRAFLTPLNIPRVYFLRVIGREPPLVSVRSRPVGDS